MNKFRKGISISLSLIIMLSLFILPNGVFADKSNEQYAPGFDTKGELVKFLKENQVSEEKQEVLIDKLAKNQLWDSYKPEKRDAIPKNFYNFDPKDGSQTRYYRFEDGSFIKIENILNDSIEIDGSEKNNKFLREKIKDEELLNKIFSHNPKKSNELENIQIPSAREMTTYGVSYGTGYAWYYDFKVSKTVGTMYASMYTEFVLVNGGDDYIVTSGVYGPQVSGFGELGQMPTVEVVRQQEDSYFSRRAIANSHWYVNYPISTPWGGSTAAGTYYLWIGVGSNTYSVSDTLPY